MSGVTQHEVEIEGKRYIVLTRQSTNHDPFGKPFKLYSFNGGESYHELMAQAFTAARDAGKLTLVGEALTDGGEYEAFLLGLAQELNKLEVGERVIIVRTETQVVALRESAVLALRASTLKDASLKLEE